MNNKREVLLSLYSSMQGNLPGDSGVSSGFGVYAGQEPPPMHRKLFNLIPIVFAGLTNSQQCKLQRLLALHVACTTVAQHALDEQEFLKTRFTDSLTGYSSYDV